MGLFNECFFDSLYFRGIGDIHDHLLVRTHASTLRLAVRRDDLLTFVKPNAHAKEFEKSSHPANNIVASVFIKIGKVASLYESMTFVAFE